MGLKSSHDRHQVHRTGIEAAGFGVPRRAFLLQELGQWRDGRSGTRAFGARAGGYTVYGGGSRDI